MMRKNRDAAARNVLTNYSLTTRRKCKVQADSDHNPHLAVRRDWGVIRRECSVDLSTARCNVHERGHRFHTALVGTTLDPEVTLLAPLLTPRVLDDPILDTLVNAPTHSDHGMIGLLPPVQVGELRALMRRCSAGVDTAGIIEEVRRGLSNRKDTRSGEASRGE